MFEERLGTGAIINCGVEAVPVGFVGRTDSCDVGAASRETLSDSAAGANAGQLWISRRRWRGGGFCSELERIG